LLLAHGRRTATAWFRAGGIRDEFRRADTLLGTMSRSKIDCFACVWFSHLRRTLPPGECWLFALDDTPTQRYGPGVEGAGLHHHPTPGPTQQRDPHGPIWVTLAWVVRHPRWHVRALPLRADLYIRRVDLDQMDADRRPAFATKLELAARRIRSLAQQVRGSSLPVWLVVNGFYAKRPVLKPARQEQVTLVGRLRCAAALRELPPAVAADQRPVGRPRVYGSSFITNYTPGRARPN